MPRPFCEKCQAFHTKGKHVDEDYHTNPGEKPAMSAEIERQTQDFLQAGGSISVHEQGETGVDHLAKDFGRQVRLPGSLPRIRK